VNRLQKASTSSLQSCPFCIWRDRPERVGCKGVRRPEGRRYCRLIYNLRSTCSAPRRKAPLWLDTSTEGTPLVPIYNMRPRLRYPVFSDFLLPQPSPPRQTHRSTQCRFAVQRPLRRGHTRLRTRSLGLNGCPWGRRIAPVLGTATNAQDSVRQKTFLAQFAPHPQHLQT
jgi:hypothetical protein